jgi:hypothetical protein
MQRVYYIVSPHGDEGWSVGVEGEQPVRFPDRKSANDAAVSAARDLWELYGLPSGVRVLDHAGAAREEQAYGD